jgi:16S rRNA (guanine1207-N2)-methyltransferase
MSKQEKSNEPFPMALPSRLLSTTVAIHNTDRVLLLNSAAIPFLSQLAQQITNGTITLAEDNIATAQSALQLAPTHLQHVAFHNYISHQPASTMDIAIMDLLYQPGNSWANYGLLLAHYALRPHGRLYVVGAKDRGILSIGKRMQEHFGNVETLTISKGHRVLCSNKISSAPPEPAQTQFPVSIFAASQLDEGTRLLIEALQVKPDDEALDIGCGAGFLGLHIARHASHGHVTMVDVSLAAIEAAQQATEQSGLTNMRILPSDGAQAVLDQRFDLVVTNPPFHQAGIQTTAIATRFIREAAQVLKPRGRFYLVANRFLKYEPTLLAHFKHVTEVAGNTRYKVLRASH